MASSVVELERLVVRLQGDATDYLDMLSKAERSTADFVKRIEGQLAAVSIGLAAPLAGIGGAGVKAFADFDQGMKKALAIMEPTDAQIKKMRDTVLDLSGQTIQSPTELANAFYTLASAGLKAEQAVSVLPLTARFATASGIDLTKATYLAVTAQGALGLRTEEVGQNLINLTRVMDTFSKANKLADATIEYFATAISTQAGASLKFFNKDVEEGASVLAIYSRAGVPAQVAGTNLSRVLRLLSQASIDNAVQQKALGFDAFDTAGKMKPLWQIIGDLEKILKPMSPQMRVATLDVLGFKAKIQQAIYPLLGFSKEIKEYHEQLKGAGGTTKQISDTILTSFTNQMTMLGNQVKVVGIEIGEALAPSLLKFGSVVAEALRWVRSLSIETKQWLVQTGLTIVGIISLAGSLFTVANIFSLFFSGLYGMALGLIIVVSVSERARDAIYTFVTGLIQTYTGLFQVVGAVLAAIVVYKVLSAILVFTGIQQVINTIAWAAWTAAVLIATGVTAVYNAIVAVLNAMVVASTGITWAYISSLLVAIADTVLWTAGIIGLIGVLAGSIGVVSIFIGVGLVVTGVMAGLAVMFALVAGAIVIMDKILVLSIGAIGLYQASWLATQIALDLYRAKLAITAALMGVWNSLVGTAIGLQTIWAVAVAFTNGVNTVFNALTALGITLWQGLQASIALAVIGQGLWAAATSASEIITWTFNAALAVMNIELAPVTIIAAVLALGLLIAAFVVTASACYGVYEAVKGTVSVLLSLPTTTGPLKQVASLFGEWYSILKDVVNLAQTDMPRAWLLLRAGFELAVSQLTDLWPPLWKFIQEGFSTLWTFVTLEFETKFQQSIANFLGQWAKLSSLLGLGLGPKIDKMLKELNEEARTTSENNLRYAKEKLEAAVADFSVVDSEATKAARDAVEFFRKGLVGPKPEAILGLDDKAIADLMKQFGELGDEGGKVLHKGLGKEIERFEAALSRSAEAITRLEEYRTRIEAPESVFKGKVGIELPKRFDAAEAGGAEKKTREEEQLDILKKINEAVRLGLKKPGVDIAPAGI